MTGPDEAGDAPVTVEATRQAWAAALAAMDRRTYELTAALSEVHFVARLLLRDGPAFLERLEEAVEAADAAAEAHADAVAACRAARLANEAAEAGQ